MKTLVVWFKKNWLTALKIAVLAVSLWVLYKELVIDQSWKGFRDFKIAQLTDQPLFWLVLVLMMVNWGLEALKWQLLLSRFEKESYYVAVKSVFTGVFISLFVNILIPNRVGEFAGRILYTKIHKAKAALISGIGSFAQFAVTVLFGSVAYLIFFNRFVNDEGNQFNKYLLIISILFFSAIIVLFYFNINIFSWLLSRPKLLRRYKKITSVFYFYHSPVLLKVFGLAVFRYAVFCTQFILLLWVCGLPISFEQGVVAVAVIFLVQTLIPTNSIIDLTVRGGVSISVISMTITSEGYDAGILAAAYLLWAINILLPGIAGAIFFAVFKYREYGNGNNA